MNSFKTAPERADNAQSGGKHPAGGADRIEQRGWHAAIPFAAFVSFSADPERPRQ